MSMEQRVLSCCLCMKRPLILASPWKVLVVCVAFSFHAASAQERGSAVPGRQLVIMVDTNPNQKNVLSIELMVAEGIVQKLAQPLNAFSVITFGVEPPVLLKSKVNANAAIAAIRDINLGTQSRGLPSAQLYNALNLAFSQFTSAEDTNSILVISEGNDSPHNRQFKDAVSHAQKLQVTCNVAMVADHTLYGGKAIQRYGFYVRELAAKTHGRYIEVSNNSKKVSNSISRLSGSMREPGHG